jgi:hypothetical protein
MNYVTCFEVKTNLKWKSFVYLGTSLYTIRCLQYTVALTAGGLQPFTNFMAADDVQICLKSEHISCLEFSALLNNLFVKQLTAGASAL